MSDEKKAGRLMALDFGAKTVGVAVTDALGLTAQGVEIIRRERENKLRQTLARIEALVQEYHVTGFVIGYPYELDGHPGERCEKTRGFSEMLQRRTGLPVVLWDERLTTVEAIELMDAQGISHKNRHLYVDKIAAVLILEDYLRNGKDHIF